MTIWFVSRHDGAVDWAARRGIARPVAHLHLAAEVCARGACYWHLCLDVPADLRGHPLSADQMDALGARLENYHVDRRPIPEIAHDPVEK